VTAVVVVVVVVVVVGRWLPSVIKRAYDIDASWLCNWVCNEIGRRTECRLYITIQLL